LDEPKAGAGSAGRHDNEGKPIAMRTINAIALLLVVVGAVNWLLVGIAKFDLVAAITGNSFGQTNALSSIVYVLVGVAGIVLLPVLGRWVTSRDSAS
jgi:uncharacterized membrane protein YuzA (DUF378 family)